MYRLPLSTQLSEHHHFQFPLSPCRKYGFKGVWGSALQDSGGRGWATLYLSPKPEGCTPGLAIIIDTLYWHLERFIFKMWINVCLHTHSTVCAWGSRGQLVGVGCLLPSVPELRFGHHTWQEEPLPVKAFASPSNANSIPLCMCDGAGGRQLSHREVPRRSQVPS